MKQLLGYQLVLDGVNIQGDDNDPTGLASFEIMDVALAHSVIATLPGFLLMPIFVGDIEEPKIVYLPDPIANECVGSDDDNPFHPESPEGRAWDRGDRSSIE